MASSRTVINAIIGAVVGVVLSFIPFSTVIGGVVAGFLEGPNERDGAVVGALAGAITFVPIAGITILVLGVLGFGMGVAAAPIEGFAVAAFVIVAFAAFVLLYTVGLSLLGGYLGAYLAREYPERRASTRRSLGMEEGERTDRERGVQRRRDRDPTRSEPRDGGRWGSNERDSLESDEYGRTDDPSSSREPTGNSDETYSSETPWQEERDE